jgi:hypothetical protein
MVFIQCCHILASGGPPFQFLPGLLKKRGRLDKMPEGISSFFLCGRKETGLLFITVGELDIGPAWDIRVITSWNEIA